MHQVAKRIPLQVGADAGCLLADQGAELPVYAGLLVDNFGPEVVEGVVIVHQFHRLHVGGLPRTGIIMCDAFDMGGVVEP